MWFVVFDELVYGECCLYNIEDVDEYEDMGIYEKEKEEEELE